MEEKQTEEILYGGNTSVVVRFAGPIGSIPRGLYGDRRLGAPVRRPDDGLTVIDWDFCGPGDPIDDLAFSAWQWIPLWADKAAVAGGHGGAVTVLEAATKLAALADGYDASADQRARLLGACVPQMAKHADGVEGLAVTDPAFARLVDLDVARNARLDALWVKDNEAVLSAALRGGA